MRLKECKKNRPIIGDKVILQLTGNPEPMSGYLCRYQPDGVEIRISSGNVTVPFVVMEEATRRLYFPKEHAMYLYRRQ
ncbi:MAG: hypothetical protein KKD14_00220 [Verrucomicrobia bacterium]|nr:hypothetical protein [Verrucomicrobiota bacterium]